MRRYEEDAITVLTGGRGCEDMGRIRHHGSDSRTGLRRYEEDSTTTVLSVGKEVYEYRMAHSMGSAVSHK